MYPVCFLTGRMKYIEESLLAVGCWLLAIRAANSQQLEANS